MELRQQNSADIPMEFMSVKTLEGFEYQQHNPFSYKPGGFARGAGHGATLKIITKTGGMFQPFLFPRKIILKEDWEYGLPGLIKMM
jgi:hypothetical protein